MRKSQGKISTVETLAGELGSMRCITTTVTGTALSTTAAHILLPAGTRFVEFLTRNYSAAVVVKVGMAPYLTVWKTADALATDPTDYSSAAQDGSASTDVVLSSLSTFANDDYVLVGAPRKFAGAVADVDAANGNASVLTVMYWDGTAWTDISATDGTASGGATMAVDGSVTWTIPSAWVPSNIHGRELYWTLWKVSAALDSSTTLNSLMSIPEYTGEFYTAGTKTFMVQQGSAGDAALYALTDAGTANIAVNVYSGAFEIF